MNTHRRGNGICVRFLPPLAFFPPKTRKKPPTKKPFCPSKMPSCPVKTPQLHPKCPYPHSCTPKIARKTKKGYTDMLTALEALEHICKLEAMLLKDGITPSCIYMNARTHSLLESPDTIIGYPVVVDNKLGEDIVCLA